ncbi:hypothetical protein F5B19DRAFT_200455 [Rostrohypoxylon terebratum]|nr:hypothetical protein F5B19DRAFT_200455 [Rostrohypoxylon terebratum]
MYVIDPDGDMILTLKNPCAPFAVWCEDDATASPGHQNSNSLAECNNENEQTPIPSLVTFRISSRHLSLASGRTRKMRHQWEQEKQSDGHTHISVEDWDSAALLTVMDIIHLRNRRVANSVTLEHLSQLAVIVDYFEFHEAVEVFSKRWISNLQPEIPTSYCRDLILWIWVSHVFQEKKVLKNVINTAVQHSPGQMQSLGLPIPDSTINKVNKQRRAAAVQIIDGLRTLRDGLLDDTQGCSYTCRCLLLGALMKGLQPYHVFDSTSEPLSGHSLVNVIKNIHEIHTPSFKSNTCNCTMDGLTSSFLNKVKEDIKIPIVRRSPWGSWG